MKTTVLVIGQNVERQIIDLHEHDVIYDETNRGWLNLCFDNRSLIASTNRRCFSELGIFKRALQLLDYQVLLPNQSQKFATRVILRANNQTKNIRVGSCDDGLWQPPVVAPKIIILLESAQLSEPTLVSINRYLDQFPKINLVIEYQPALTKTTAGRQLLERAQLVWADLISYQTGETENLLNQFAFANQLLLINHHTGLSLSDKQRTYKLTNADYLELKSLEWLAIAIKVLTYDFDIEDKLELIARIGQSIVRTNQAKINHSLANLTHQNPAIELIRGEPNLAKKLNELVRQLTQSTGVAVDFGKQKLPIVQELLQVRDLPSKTKLINLSYQQYMSLLKHQLPLVGQLQQELHLAVELDTRACNLSGGGRETFNQNWDLDERLNQLQFQQIPVVKTGADFLFDQSLPSDRLILANCRELAELASRALTRGIVPVLEIRAQAQINFDSRPGAVVLDYLRILRSLEVELRARRVISSQVIVWLKLPTIQGQSPDANHLKAWSEAITQQIKHYRLGFGPVQFKIDTDWQNYLALRRTGADVVLDGFNYRFLTDMTMTDQQLRIKFSQLLAEIS